VTNTKKTITEFFESAPWVFFYAVVIFYCAMYAPIGLENNDTGFTMGMAHQFFMGERFYDQIIMVRPPVSPILHSFVFYPPFSNAPLLSDRIFFFFQIAIYSGLSALLAKNFFAWPPVFTAIVASVSFVFSAHSFPPMGWHTVDGIMFSVISIYYLAAFVEDNNQETKITTDVIFNKKHIYLFLSAAFSILAAGSKQPFYIVPLVILSASLITGGVRRFTAMLIALICSAIIFTLLISPYVDFHSLFGSISSQTTLADLLNAGLFDYFKDIKRPKSIYFVWPALGVIGYIIFKNKTQKYITAKALVVTIYLYILAIAYFYFSATKFSIPSAYIDTMFVGTLLFSVAKFYIHRDSTWVTIIAIHAIGWAASISWGYQTTILYSAPTIIVISFALHQITKTHPKINTILTPILPLTIIIFYFANQFYFSSEGPVKRSSITADMGQISQIFSHIKSTQKQFNLYSELNSFITSTNNKPFVVLPNIPLAHTMANQVNPIGIDWAMNAEIGNNMERVRDRINTSVEYAIVYKNASPSPNSSGKFGSEITNYVKDKWTLTHQSDNFYYFKNPSI
jgi:hypothetical protein